MKKIILVFICLMMVMSVNAQSEVIETQETYCMIVATQNFMSSKCSITIDYGQSTRLIDGSSKMKLVLIGNFPPLLCATSIKVSYACLIKIVARA